MTTPSFRFYEKVRINSGNGRLSEINGELGAILGRAQSEEGRWSYAVHVYRDGVCWSCDEADLVATGECDVRATFYSV